jgi:hypothetical protein
MELELTEPQLYFHDVPTATDRMTAIIEEYARRHHGDSHVVALTTRSTPSVLRKWDTASETALVTWSSWS